MGSRSPDPQTAGITDTAALAQKRARWGTPTWAGAARGQASHLLLLQSFHERVFQPVGVLGLESLLLVGGHALLAQNLTALLLLPVRGEIRAALGTNKGFDPQE